MTDCVPAIIRGAIWKRDKRRFLPRLDDIPIPKRIRPDKRWPKLLKEIADHVGGYAALQIVEHFAGLTMYIPRNPRNSPFRSMLTDDQVALLSHVFGNERLHVPGREILRIVRVRQIAALARACRLSVMDAAFITGTPHRHMGALINGDECFAEYDMIELPAPREIQMLRAASAIVQKAADDAELAQGVAEELLQRINRLADSVSDIVAQAIEPSLPPEIDMLCS